MVAVTSGALDSGLSGKECALLAIQWRVSWMGSSLHRAAVFQPVLKKTVTPFNFRGGCHWLLRKPVERLTVQQVAGIARIPEEFVSISLVCSLLCWLHPAALCSAKIGSLSHLS